MAVAERACRSRIFAKSESQFLHVLRKCEIYTNTCARSRARLSGRCDRRRFDLYNNIYILYTMLYE